jgi:hypothetical protein
MHRVVIVFVLTGGLMLFIFHSADWYANTSALPRYCASPGKTVEIVEEILTSSTPGEGEKRRPYIVAAKLIFLVPQERNETRDNYLERLRLRISQSCGESY